MLLRILLPPLLVLCGTLLPAQPGTVDEGRRFPLPRRTMPLEKALIKLSDAGALLSYRPDQLPQTVVAVPGGRRTLARWLEFLLRGTELTYTRGAAGYLVVPDPQLLGQTFSAFGMITDARSGERLIGATVQLPGLGRGVLTNEYGFYTLPVHGGRHRFRVTYIGYLPQEVDLVLRSDTLLHFRLEPNNELPQIVVTALQGGGELADYTESGIRIGSDEVDQLSGPGGQADPIQLMRLLPGVTSGADGIGGIFVRGSEAGHNLILLDGVPVYNLSHAAGLFSIFSNQAIRRIDLYKDALPARFGGRIGGVLDVHTRDGNLYDHEISVGSNLLSSQVSAEGPLRSGESSFLLTGRYFWAGGLLRDLSRDQKARFGRRGQADYSVHDFNFKLNQRAGEKGRLYLSVYSGLDDYANRAWQTDTVVVPTAAGARFVNAFPSLRFESARWGTTVAALRYNHVFNDRLFGNFRLSYSDLITESYFERSDSIKETTNEIYNGEIFSGRYASEMRQWGAAFDGQLRTGDRGHLRFGGEFTLHSLTPQLSSGPVPLSFHPNLDELDERDDYQPLQYTIYGSQTGQLGSLHYRLGLRGSLWRNRARNYYSLSPRLLLAGPLTSTTDWRLSYDRTVQPMHLLGSRTISLPFDLWVPSTPNIAPAVADQFAGQLTFNLAPDWKLESAAYYKRMSRLLAFREGAQNEGHWEDYVNQGSGRSYGLEGTINRGRGRLRGWVNYSYARSDRRFPDINLNRVFPFRYDRRHTVNAVLIYQLGERTTITGSWRYGSGAAFSLSLESVSILTEDGREQKIGIVGEKNALRLKPNHRLDLNLHTILSSPESRFEHTIDLGLYNVYNRHNPIYYDSRTSYFAAQGELQPTVSFTQTYVAPLLPVMSYRLSFSTRRPAAFGR